MGQPKYLHVVVLNAEVWAAAEELAELAGLRPGELIETMLLDLRESIVEEAEPREALPEGVIPISRGQRRNRRSRRPRRSGL